MQAQLFYEQVSASPAVGSHKFKTQHFKTGASNPRTVACLDLKTPFESADLRGAGPVRVRSVFKSATRRNGPSPSEL